ncbi:PEP-CTERM sorting domain-containing protein [[Empedobacter] haloabium]|uniref:PEP-CTERM sorting domain-containing protein n=1 Tax=[Empedobacter] haloabium TaxID=592317 RepID=A0ABZ1UID0_9BURK
MKQLLARLILLACSLAAGTVQAVPVTFTTVSTGDAGEFDFYSGDRGLGTFQGIGPYTLTVSGSIDNAESWQRTVLDITLTVNGKTNRMQAEGVAVTTLATRHDGSGSATTVLSQSFTSPYNEYGPVFYFHHSFRFDPQVLGTSLPSDTGDAPLQSLGGSFSLSFEYNNDASGFVFGTASGNYDHGTLQVIGAVPEPASYATLLVGLALAGAFAKRRAPGTGCLKDASLTG